MVDGIKSEVQNTSNSYEVDPRKGIVDPAPDLVGGYLAILRFVIKEGRNR